MAAVCWKFHCRHSSAIARNYIYCNVTCTHHRFQPPLNPTWRMSNPIDYMYIYYSWPNKNAKLRCCCCMRDSFTLTRTSPAFGGCTSICSMTNGFCFSQHTAARHVITCTGLHSQLEYKNKVTAYSCSLLFQLFQPWYRILVKCTKHCLRWTWISTQQLITRPRELDLNRLISHAFLKS